MTERQPLEIRGNYGNRSEYHASADEYLVLKNDALESIEDVLLIDAKNENRTLRSTFEKGLAFRELSIAYTDPETEETYYYGNRKDILSVTWQLRAVATEVYIQTEMSIDSLCREVAKVAIREYVYGVRDPIMTDYTFEKYPNNVVHAIVTRTDLEKEYGTDDRSMTPYDFGNFFERMNVITAMRSGVLIGNGTLSEGDKL